MDRPIITRPFLHLLFILWFSSTIAKNLEIPRYETAYACEGKLLKIECKEGEVIRLIRANYGRFSITICNDHGNTDWSVNCMSPKSLRVLHGRCAMEPHCSIQASTSTFGDPCPGTLKYLEAHYQCISVISKPTTGRPSPPWLITSQPPSVWSTISPTARPPPPPPKVSAITTWTPVKMTSSTAVTTVTPVQPSRIPPPVEPIEVNTAEKKPVQNNEHTYQSPPEEITTLPYSTTVFPHKVTEENTVTFKYVPSSSVPWPLDNYNIKKCSPTTARNLYWNWTQVGDRSVQPCPGGATGLARWKCLQFDNIEEPQWYPATPDLSECRSVWLTSLESRVIEGDSLIAITSDLSQVTSSKTLYGGDMMITTKIIKKMAQKMSEDIQTFPDQRQREAIVTELLHGVVRTGSNLLDNSQHPSWRDLSYKEQMRVATSLLIGLEENAFLLADTVVREKIVEQTVKNIMLSVRVLETKNIKSATFPSEATTDKWSASNDWLELPRGALLENSEGGLVRLVFVAFDRLEEILQWQPESQYDSETQIQRNLSRVLNSKIISASLGKGRHIQLSEPVRLSLKHLKTENVSNPSCVFWDYTMSTWSEEGCHVESTNRSHTTCLCDHLTNFAILMDVHATYLPVSHQIALQIITYVGCIISIVCLVLTFFTFQIFRALKSDRTTIHKHLCFCLLVAELLFVVGIGQTSDRVICGVVAGLLHLFFLCAFAWMFLEGFQLYVMLIEVFETEKSRLRWYYTLAYGIPLFIVAISAIIDPYSYGTENYCWLRADNFFIFSFVGPVILVILANVVFLGMAVIMMCRHGNASVSIKSKEHSRLASARTWLRGAFVLVFLLGLTWTFGLLYLNKESVTMAYIFTTLNSLQGLFIFVFHCIQNEKVRKEYHKYIRRHSWLPKCLRCSKSNASGAGSSGSGSSGLGKDRGTSQYAGSVGNTSALNSHSTDNSGLSPHGTSVGTNVNNIIISNNLNNSANLRPSALVQVLNHHNNASTTTTTNHNRLHNVSQVARLLQQYILQRGWSSRSCTTMNRIGKSPVLVTSSIAATMVATTSRIHYHQRKVDSEEGDGSEPLPSPSAPLPLQEYDDDFSANTVNNATLPYFRNSHKGSSSIISTANENNSISNPNFPKSASSWGPLHKPMHWKNISFKSFSRDSGHGASEQEESPHSQIPGSNNLNDCRFNNMKNNRKHTLKSPNLNLEVTMTNNLPVTSQAEMSKYLYRSENYQYSGKPYNQQQQHQIQMLHQPNVALKKKNNGSGLRAASPWNHTYTEIHDNRSKRSSMSNNDEDPVYEEIERNEIQVSDMSDEDGKRQSDMSRQSSRSYGDHKPLIPYSPAIDRSINSCLEVMTKQKTKEHARYLTDYRLTRPQAYRGENARSLAAVLDGETVVCHLEPPDQMYPHDYNSRTMVFSQFSES